MNLIYRFRPFLKSVIWGGDAIITKKQLPIAVDNVGESWEISSIPRHISVAINGEDSGRSLTELINKYKGALIGDKVYQRFGDHFPLLIKIIDANQDLSVQVHPDDKMAHAKHNCNGKTEMWYVIETKPDAKIVAGLKRSITHDSFRQLVNDNEIMSVLASHDSHPGDVFFLPAGRIHAIGAGNLIAEIQQTSDITYRVYDYDRKDASGCTRQLHIEEAAEAIDYHVYPDYLTQYDHKSQGLTPLVHCNYFEVDKLTIDGAYSLEMPQGTFLITICVKGNCLLVADDESSTLNVAETALIAAKTKSLFISGHSQLLTISLPT